MTRKDYQMIAEVISQSFVDVPDEDSVALFVIRLANALEADNPHFNRPKFIAACLASYATVE